MTRILVVDDTAVDRRVAGGLIEQAGEVEVIYGVDGEDALEKMRQSLPDLVVTDLQMPELDGLGLVTRIRMLYPDVPVILMTAKGSEAIAIEALEQGAASYVPKSQLNEKLAQTVADVLAVARADRTYEQLLACQKRIEFQYELPNDPQLIDVLVDLVQQMVDGMRLCDHTGKLRLGVALKEAMLNALYRGNLEITFEQMQASRENLLQDGTLGIVDQRRNQAPYRDRTIRLDAIIEPQQARFIVRDCGPGFDHKQHSTNETLASSGGLENRQGRGLILMRSFMDEVQFNGQGNEVTLVKRGELTAESQEM